MNSNFLRSLTNNYKAVYNLFLQITAGDIIIEIPIKVGGVDGIERKNISREIRRQLLFKESPPRGGKKRKNTTHKKRAYKIRKTQRRKKV